MQHHTEWLHTPDGNEIFMQRWMPEGTPSAYLLIVHGYAEHSGRYAHVARFFKDHGFGVFAYDRRGHGRSSGLRGYIARFELHLKDLTRVLDTVRTAAGRVPVFLFGHSAGGAIVTRYVLTRAPKVQGVLLSGAALKLGEDISPFLQRIAGLAGALLPKVKTIKLDSASVSRDPEVVAAYDADPLVYHGATYARYGAELIKTTKAIQRDMEEFRAPVLIMHGGADRLTEPEGSRQLYRRASSKDKSLKMYEGLYHELVNEPEQETVMQDMLNWMQRRLGIA